MTQNKVGVPVQWRQKVVIDYKPSHVCIRAKYSCLFALGCTRAAGSLRNVVLGSSLILA